MDKTRLWIIGAVLAMVAVGGLGWVLGVQPQLDAAAAADAQARQVAAANAASGAVLARLQEDSENLGPLKETLSGLQASVPGAADLPAFTDELNAFAAADGVTISAWQISDAQAYVPPVAPAAAAPSAGGTTGSTPSPSATPAPAPTSAAAATPAAGAPPAADPLITATDFAVLPVSVTVTGPYPNIVAFVDAAQKGERLFLVNGLDISPNASGAGFDGKVSGFVYVLGGSAGTATK